MQKKVKTKQMMTQNMQKKTSVGIRTTATVKSSDTAELDDR